MKKNKFNNIAGLTLIEILIGRSNLIYYDGSNVCDLQCCKQ